MSNERREVHAFYLCSSRHPCLFRQALYPFNREDVARQAGRRLSSQTCVPLSTAMRPTFKSRKPIDQLRPVDLKTYPVWEFASDEEGEEEQDETWVRPMRTKQIPANAYSLSVSARLRTPHGTKYQGIVTVNTVKGFEAVHAAILTEDDYVFIPWPGMADASELAKRAAQELGLKAKDLFPLAYCLAVLVEGEVALREGVYCYSASDA